MRRRMLMAWEKLIERDEDTEDAASLPEGDDILELNEVG